jgi:membrane protein
MRVPGFIRTPGHLIWQTLSEFVSDGCGSMAAALSYYTIFSLSPLLVLLMLIVGTFTEPVTLHDLLSTQIGALLGPRGAQQILELLRNAARPEITSVAAVLGALALVFGATTAFANLQGALNAAWGVAPNPYRGDVRNFLLKRVISLTMVLVIGFLLVVSLVMSALLAGFGHVLSAVFVPTVSATVMRAVELGISFMVVSLMFAALFKYVPDAVVRSRHALIGGALTGVLFTVGKAAFGYYIGRSDAGNVFGAAGSLAVALLWLNYTAIILLLGAEFTQVWATRKGAPIYPERGAVRVVRQHERVEAGPGAKAESGA